LVWERIIRGLGVLTVAGFLVIVLTPASNMIGRRLAVSPEVLPAGAIVVLGAGVLHGGILDEESMRRFIRGIELYKEGLAPVIVFSGTGRGDEPRPTEAEIRVRLATTMGIPSEAIIKEETANTTREESVHIAAQLRRRNISSILLVTESLHMRRARSVFERAGLRVLPATSADYSIAAVSPGDRLWLTIRILQESAALIYYRAAGYI
jgi:uncharacterized SAM-binding protein YcdF (DUF218 family)